MANRHMQAGGREQIGVTIGVCAYNEERNIGNLLQAILSQKTEVARIEEVLVVASGCTDRTPEIVRSFQDDHEDIRLVVETERRGKASAVNKILERAVAEVVVLEGADTIPHPQAVEFLTRPFANASVGVVAARPVTTDDENTFWGGLSHALWDLHHHVSLQNPKTGEMFAFRRVLDKLPGDVGADEDWIRNEVESNGYQVKYAPEALVYNSGPKSISEFLNQRVRINTQQIYQRRAFSFVPPTWRAQLLFNAFVSHLRGKRARLGTTIVLLALEATARIYSILALAMKRQNVVRWVPLPSTKVVELSRTEPERNQRREEGQR